MSVIRTNRFVEIDALRGLVGFLVHYTTRSMPAGDRIASPGLSRSCVPLRRFENARLTAAIYLALGNPVALIVAAVGGAALLSTHLLALRNCSWPHKPNASIDCQVLSGDFPSLDEIDP